MQTPAYDDVTWWILVHKRRKIGPEFRHSLPPWQGGHYVLQCTVLSGSVVIYLHSIVVVAVIMSLSVGDGSLLSSLTVLCQRCIHPCTRAVWSVSLIVWSLSHSADDGKLNWLWSSELARHVTCTAFCSESNMLLFACYLLSVLCDILCLSVVVNWSRSCCNIWKIHKWHWSLSVSTRSQSYHFC